MPQNPSVGRVVHYCSYGTPGGEFQSLARAAIITAVLAADDGTVSLCAINPTGLFFHERCPYSETYKPGHWSWPPRV